jgi:hypothetical protein
LEELLGYEKTGGKVKKTEWIAKINELRKIVMHPAKGRAVNLEQLNLLEQYCTWLEAQATGAVPLVAAQE